MPRGKARSSEIFPEICPEFGSKTCGQVKACAFHSRANVMFCVAGFRPGSRGPFVPAKVAKTKCAEHVQQLEGGSPFDNLMEVKS